MRESLTAVDRRQDISFLNRNKEDSPTLSCVSFCLEEISPNPSLLLLALPLPTPRRSFGGDVFRPTKEQGEEKALDKKIRPKHFLIKIPNQFVVTATGEVSSSEATVFVLEVFVETFSIYNLRASEALFRAQTNGSENNCHPFVAILNSVLLIITWNERHSKNYQTMSDGMT